MGVHVSSEGFLSKGLLGKTKRPCWRESLWSGEDGEEQCKGS